MIIGVVSMQSFHSDQDNHCHEDNHCHRHDHHHDDGAGRADSGSQGCANAAQLISSPAFIYTRPQQSTMQCVGFIYTRPK